MTAPRRTIRTDDSGAVLILALIIVTVIALVVGALLSFGDTSLRTTVAMRQQATTAATADAGAQAALNTLRRNSYNNDATSSADPHCFGTGTDETTPGVWLKLADIVPGSTGAAANTALVQCEPQPGTGVDGGLVPISGPQKPGNAILTLGQIAGEDGLNVKALNTALPFSVHGGIVSNSNINVTSGTLETNTTAFAHTGCAGNIVSSPPPVCNAPTLEDPNYAADTSTVPPYKPVPANAAANCPGGVMTFEPGYYDDAAALSDLMSGNGACKHSVWWFRPGTYYFDFQNTSGTHEWLIRDGQLIAGTPAGSTPTALTPPPKPATVPGACESPIRNEEAVGVQFVFGGDSRLQVANSADAEICGTYYTDRPPLAIYGLKTGVATPTTANDSTATIVTSTAFTAPAGQTLPSTLGTADGVVSSWAPARNNETATLTLSPFVSAAGIPAGSILSSARLRILYGGSTAASDRTVTVTPSSSSGAGTALPAVDVPNKRDPQPLGTTQTVDLTATLSSSVHDKGLTGLSVAYATKMSTPQREVVDAVFVDLTYTVPTFRGETTAAVPGNCLARAYSGGSGGQCAVLSTSSAYSGHFYIQATTYTPIAPIDLTLSNITQQVMRFGVISRTLWLKETGAVSYIGPVIEIPNDSLGYGLQGTVAHLTVYVCRPGTPCTAANHPAQPSLIARVFIKDPNGDRRLLVQSWAVRR